MYVSKLTLRNWRNFTKAEVNLGQTTYLIGPNASGKSNFLDVFRFMRDIVNPNGGGLQQALASRGGLSKVRSLEAKSPPEVKIEIELRESLADSSTDSDWKYVLWIKNKAGKKKIPVVAKEEVYKNGTIVLDRSKGEDKDDPELLTQTHLEQINMNKPFREIAKFFQGVRYLHLIPQLLKFGDQLSLGHIESDPFGQGLLEEIAETPAKTRKFRLGRIESILKSVIPNLEQLRFVKGDAPSGPHLEMLYNHWRPNAGWLREDQFSDGTLRMIALVWVLMTSNNMILLEEPELSLHNKVVEQIPYMIYKMRQSRKKVSGQILISTHSESMLSDKSIVGNYLILTPGTGGAFTTIQEPNEMDIKAMRAGLSPADVLLPKTSVMVGSI